MPEPALPSVPTTPVVSPPPDVGTTPPKPVTPPVQGLLLLAQVRGYVEEAIQHLQANAGAAARKILSGTVIPWFYASAREHSDSLPNAEAHTAARWHAEEATRRIEAKKLGEARDILRDNVLAWLVSPGPIEMGLLSVPAARKKQSLPERRRRREKRRQKKQAAKRPKQKRKAQAQQRKRKRNNKTSCDSSRSLASDTELLR